MPVGAIPFGSYVLKSATANVKASDGVLLGFYVNNTSTGTLILYDSATTGTAVPITGTITPAIGWNPLPVAFVNGLYAVIGGSSLSVTFVIA